MNIQPELIPSIALTLPFIVAFVGVYLILWKPLFAFLEGRDHAVHQAKHDADHFAHQAAERLARLEARLATAEADARAVRQTRREAAVAEENRIIHAAREAADKQVAAAVTEVRAQGSIAAAALRGQADDLARRIAGRALGRELAS